MTTALRTSLRADQTAAWLRSIAPDYAPPGYSESVRSARGDSRWEPSRSEAHWVGHHCCHHTDSNFWFWMWAMNSGRRETHIHHHYAAGVGHVAGGYRGGRSVSPPERERREKREGMSGGERVAAGVAGVAAVIAAAEAWDHFSDRESEMREPLEKTRALRRNWLYETVAPQDEALYKRLQNVFKAQEKVEKTRVRRLSTYKWSSLILGAGGVALVAGALLNIPEVVIVGLVVGAIALTILGTTFLISLFKDDTRPAKKAYEDYRIVTTHFLAREIPEAPPAYAEFAPSAPPESPRARPRSQGEFERRAAQHAFVGSEAAEVASRRAMAADWAARAGESPVSAGDDLPTFEELEARLEALAARDVQVIKAESEQARLRRHTQRA